MNEDQQKFTIMTDEKGKEVVYVQTDEDTDAVILLMLNIEGESCRCIWSAVNDEKCKIVKKVADKISKFIADCYKDEKGRK